MVTVTLKDKIGNYAIPPVATGTAIPWTSYMQQTAYVIHRKAFVVVPVNGINGPPAELRMYTNAENLPSVINDPTQYVGLSREIGTNQRANSPFEKSGATKDQNKPFAIYTDSATGTSYVSIAMRVEDQQFNKRLATQQSKEFNTFRGSMPFCDPETFSNAHAKRYRTNEPASLSSDHHHADRFSDRRGNRNRDERYHGYPQANWFKPRFLSLTECDRRSSRVRKTGVGVKTINSYYAPVSNSRLTTALGIAPSFPGFSYVTALQVTGTDQYGDPYGAANSTATPAPTRVNLDNYPGWTGSNTSYLASVKMQEHFSAGAPLRTGVKRAINYTVVPLFQATAFFEDDLELYRPATMTIGGTRSHKQQGVCEFVFLRCVNVYRASFSCRDQWLSRQCRPATGRHLERLVAEQRDPSHVFQRRPGSTSRPGRPLGTAWIRFHHIA